MIKTLGAGISEYISSVGGGDPNKIYHYGDTDSVVGSSEIVVNNTRCSIGSFFDSIETPTELTPSGAEVRMVNGYTTITIDDNGDIVEKPINYVMRHKTEKQIYRVSINGRSVEITEDHSLIVRRRGKFTSTTVADRQFLDEIVYVIDGGVFYDPDFFVEYVGTSEQYVYDIEVDGVHRFIANDILVHNSCYFVIEDFVQKVQSRHGIPDDKLVDFIDKFVNENVQKCIRTTLDNLGDYMNFYQNALGAKRECIAKSGIWKAKKLYALHVWDMEGVRYDHPKVKVTGIETQKSSTPKVVRDALLKSLDILLGGTEQELRDYVVQFENEFKTMPLEAISFPRSVNNVEKYVGADGMPIKGCPGHVRAAIAHNTAVSKLGIQDVPMITSGDKVLFCYMKPNPYHAASIAFVDRPPKELNLQNYIDYDTQFEKAFLAPLTSLMDAVKWGLTDKSSLDEFF